MWKSQNVFYVSQICFKKCLFVFSDAPEIEQGETFIHTGEQADVRIFCTVHSSPKADITWLKDGRVSKYYILTLSEDTERKSHISAWKLKFQ
jgi:hypothetical protein